MSTRYVSTWPDRFLPRFIKFFEVRIQPRGEFHPSFVKKIKLLEMKNEKKKLCGFSSNIILANFETFLWNINLRANLLFGRRAIMI